jgi:hypothetical protein
MLNFLKSYYSVYIRPLLLPQPVDYSKERLLDISEHETDELDCHIVVIEYDVEAIRYSAYLLAEADGFKNTPEYYWHLAESLQP